MRRKWFKGPVIVLGAAVVLVLVGFTVSGLWNALLPALFGWHTITFWQAVGLLILARLLFGRLGGGGRRRRFVWGRNDLTPEERERFRRAMEEKGRRRGCGGGGQEAEGRA